MNKLLLTTILSLAAGFAAGAWTTSASQPAAPGDADPASVYFDVTASAAERLAALERVVEEERDARLVLEEQMQSLYADLERLDVPELRDLLEQLAGNRQVGEQPAAAEQDGQARSGARDRRRGMRNYAKLRAEQLVAGGFTETRAGQILQIEEQLRMATLQAEYEARRNGEVTSPWTQAYGYQQNLRDRLGDAEYERYLRANGSQASITVADVISISPANRAGLRRGDRIVNYDGDRVFSMYELKAKAFDGEPGEDVIVDIERDGQRIQLVLPRGPLGITGNGASVGPRGLFGG